jgi:hypothetical protein
MESHALKWTFLRSPPLLPKNPEDPDFFNPDFKPG